MAKNLRWGRRRFPPKCMYSAVSGILFFEHGFNGKVCFVRIAKWKVAKRLSYKWENGENVILHRKGERYPVDCEMNAKRFKRHLRFIGRAMRNTYHWVAATFILNAADRPSGTAWHLPGGW